VRHQIWGTGFGSETCRTSGTYGRVDMGHRVWQGRLKDIRHLQESRYGAQGLAGTPEGHQALTGE